MDNTVYLIDGSSYIYRAFHAIRGLTNSKGFPTNAAFGFTKMLLRLMEERKPDYMAVVFDSKGPTFRHEMYADYKANRPETPEELTVQRPYIQKIAQGMGVPTFERSGYEADDIIGTLARRSREMGFSVVMVTGDKDFLQLVDDGLVIWDPMKDKTTGVQEVVSAYGVEPSRMIDIMGFSGDSSDNIPGVPGIGPKTAQTLVKTYQTMEGVYDNIESFKRNKQRENLLTYKDQAFLSRKLVRIDTDVPLPADFSINALKRGDPETGRLSELFRELEFRQFQELYQDQPEAHEKKYAGIYTETELDDLIERIQSSEIVSVDTETTSQDPMNARLVGISVSVKEHEAFYIPLKHDYAGAPNQLELNLALRKLKPLMEDKAVRKIGQNIKYDMIVLSNYGIRLQGAVFDTMLGSYLINPSRRAHNLDQIALDYLNFKKISYEDVAGKGKSSIPFSMVSVDKAVAYACEDADITLSAYHVLNPKLEALNLKKLFDNMEIPLIPVLAKMEKAGVRVDKARLRELSERFANQLDELENKIYESAGETFNIKSSQQLGAVLFDKLNLPVKKKTKKKTGYSTDVDVLTELSIIHELPAMILRHRTLSRLKSAYTDSLIDLINPETKRIHTSFNQSVTATGRLSSSDPNLQNIPIRTPEGREIRSAFVAGQNMRLVSADYSQIELRILAHYSGDETLIRAFQEDEDIHTRTASDIFNLPPAEVTAEQRRQAKAVNFGIIYGMSAFGLSKELGIDNKTAKARIDSYFDRYKGVKRFLDHTVEKARKEGKTESLFGRIRYLPDITSSNSAVRGFAERTAINTPIQGTAADLIKAAMIKVDSEIEHARLKSVMLLSVHDELIFEAPCDETEDLKQLLRQTMETIWEFDVPLKVNVNHGENWSDAH